LRRPRPSFVALYEQIFRCPIAFAQPTNSISFSQADALRPFVSQATTAALLNPDITLLHEGTDEIKEKAPKWMLHINVPIGD